MHAPHDADDALAQSVLATGDDFRAPSPMPSSGVPMTPPPAPEPSPEPEHIPEFDPRYRMPFEGLLYLGHLTDTEVFHGHRFRLVTPSSTERLQIGLAIKEYDGTVGFDFAYSCAFVAAFLTEVDGHELPRPITNDPKDTAMEQRFAWVLNNLKKPVIDHLFNACFRLDGEVREVLDAMGKASG